MEIRVSLDKIFPNPYQPESRLNIDDATREKFGKSIQEHGLIQTPVARKKIGTRTITTLFNAKDEVPYETGDYEMGDGWLRLQGFRWLKEHGAAGFDEITIDVRTLTDRQMANMVLEANSVRKDLSPIEQANFFKKYLTDFKITQTELARIHNITQGEVANTIRLLDLPGEVQAKVISQEITETHARQLLRLNYNPELQKKILETSVKRELSVNELSNEVARQMYHESKPLDEKYTSEKPEFDIAKCEGCEHRQKIGDPYSSDRKTLRCLDPRCWEKKQDQAQKDKAAQLAAEVAAAKGDDKAGGILDLQKLGWRDFQDLEGYKKIDNPGECKTCPNRAQGKSWGDKLKPVCTNVKCFQKKEKLHQAKEAEFERQKEQFVTDRLRAACSILAMWDALKIIVRLEIKNSTKDTQEKYCRTHGIENINALEDCPSFEQQIKDTAQFVLERERHQGNRKLFDYSLASLEGELAKFSEPIKAYQLKYCKGCRRADEAKAKVGTGELYCLQVLDNYQRNEKCWHFLEPLDAKKSRTTVVPAQDVGADEDEAAADLGILVPCETCANDGVNCRRERFHSNDEGDGYICESRVPKEATEQEPIVINVTQTELSVFAASNSCNEVPTGKIKKPFHYDGKDYICIGSVGKGGIDYEADAYLLTPPGSFQGEIRSHKDNEGKYTYHGELVKFGKMEFVITGPETIFKDPEAEQLWKRKYEKEPVLPQL